MSESGGITGIMLYTISSTRSLHTERASYGPLTSSSSMQPSAKEIEQIIINAVNINLAFSKSCKKDGRNPTLSRLRPHDALEWL